MRYGHMKYFNNLNNALITHLNFKYKKKLMLDTDNVLTFKFDNNKYANLL